MDPQAANPASLAQRALPRQNPRQEPSALTVHAGICAGGGPSDLPRRAVPTATRVLSFPVCAGAEAPRYRAPASSQPRVVVAPSEDSRCWAARTAGHLRARCRARPIVPPPRLGRSRAQFGTAQRNTPRRARCHRIHRNPMAAEAGKRSRRAGMPPDYVPLASAVLAGAELRRATGQPKAAS